LKVLPYTEVSAALVEEPGAKGVRRRVVISEDDGAGNFIMRVFEVEEGGFTPRHQHDWEHEVFILSGRGVVVSEHGDFEVKPGDVIFIPPNEDHQFKNPGPGILEFICLIPTRTG
jgi:quercetin dioxygenase-like cupin family protein